MLPVPGTAARVGRVGRACVQYSVRSQSDRERSNRRRSPWDPKLMLTLVMWLLCMVAVAVPRHPSLVVSVCLSCSFSQLPHLHTRVPVRAESGRSYCTVLYCTVWYLGTAGRFRTNRATILYWTCLQYRTGQHSTLQYITVSTARYTERYCTASVRAPLWHGAAVAVCICTVDLYCISLLCRWDIYYV